MSMQASSPSPTEEARTGMSPALMPWLASSFSKGRLASPMMVGEDGPLSARRAKPFSLRHDRRPVQVAEWHVVDEHIACCAFLLFQVGLKNAGVGPLGDIVGAEQCPALQRLLVPEAVEGQDHLLIRHTGRATRSSCSAPRSARVDEGGCGNDARHTGKQGATGHSWHVD